MTTLRRKLVRDLWRLKGQVATIAVVLACGIMAMVMLRSTWGSLLSARDSYYADYRFADVYVHLERAPDAAAERLAGLPGVAVVYPRVVDDVMVPVDGEPDPVTGRIVSIPDDGDPALNGLYLRSGRLPLAGAADEAVLLEQFAVAHRMSAGDRLPVVINGRLRQLQIVGVALSPEYVLAMSGRETIADNRRFAVLWMLRGAVAPAFRMEGAFNDVALKLEPGARAADVLQAVNRELAPYGGRPAVARAKQLSNYALSSELGILRTLALVIPAVFLAVAAFLVHVVVSRLVFLERTQIAVLKALGLSDGRIALHYLALVALVVALAAPLGIATGAWAGAWMTDLYSAFYRFPTGVFHVPAGMVLVTVGIGLAAAVAGALGAVRRVVRLPPAQAMRPPAPLSYRTSLVERVGLGGVVGPSAMMAVREIERRPLRFLLSTLGIAMGVAIFVMGRFSWDSFDHLMDEVFLREHQEDLTVSLARPRPDRIVRELAHLPGVSLAEGHRLVPVRFRAGARWRDSVITGLPHPSALRHLLDHGERPLELPASGLIVTDRLAELLGVRVGETVDVDLLEGDWSTHELPIAGLIDEAFGLQGYARADWLAGELGEQPQVSMVLLRVDADRRDELRARLKRLPEVIGVTSASRVIEQYRAQTGESMLVMTLILTLSAAAIAVGVVYNNARIALSVRSRDLASLRVLGFTRREISNMFLGELAVQVALGIPAGLLIGTWWSRAFAAGIDPETIRFPLHLSAVTYAAATTIALVSGLLSGLLVRRKLDRLDLIGVLKSASE